MIDSSRIACIDLPRCDRGRIIIDSPFSTLSGRFRMNKLVIGAIGVIVAVVAAGIGFWFGQQQPAGGAAANKIAVAPSVAPAGAGVAVEATKVVRLALPQGITAVGSLRSDESVTLRPEVAGRINAIHFREGERVSKGAPLVKLDPSVTEAEAQQARANFTLAKAKYDRAIDLQGKGFIS